MILKKMLGQLYKNGMLLLIKYFLGIALCLHSFIVFSQGTDDVIEVSFDKTVMIIFGNVQNDGNMILGKPNVGSSDLVNVVVSRNKILLQANEEFFPETNLFVELQSGDVFSFILKYNNSPKILKHNVVTVVDNATTVSEAPVRVSSTSTANAVAAKPVVPPAVTNTKYSDVMKNAEYYSKEKNYLSLIAVVQQKLIFYVGGIWAGSDNRIYFKVNLVNDSPISYDIGSKNFFIQKEKKAEAEKMKPEFVFNEEQKRVDAKTTSTYVFVFTKFSLGEKGKFVLQLWEKSGDRNLELSIHATDLLNAKIGM